MEKRVFQQQPKEYKIRNSNNMETKELFKKHFYNPFMLFPNNEFWSFHFHFISTIFLR